MALLPCPYLDHDVELTDERQAHIAERHPDLLPQHFERVEKTVADPDQVRRSERFGNARLFARWFEDLRQGKYVVVVVISDNAPVRNWIVTAYITRRLSGGTVEWTRN